MRTEDLFTFGASRIKPTSAHFSNADLRVAKIIVIKIMTAMPIAAIK